MLSEVMKQPMRVFDSRFWLAGFRRRLQQKKKGRCKPRHIGSFPAQNASYVARHTSHVTSIGPIETCIAPHPKCLFYGSKAPHNYQTAVSGNKITPLVFGRIW
jgi:hypothetical protein